jgi:hypothetical protein
MELAAFTAITKALQGIMNMAGEFSKAEERKRERVAAWLQELSEVIQDIADKLEFNDYPHNTCAQMEIMVEHFPSIVDDFIQPKKLDKLVKALKASTQVEKLFGEILNMKQKERDEKISILLTASGKLSGLASVIRHMD